MVNIVHPDNRIYYSEGDKELSSAVHEVREIILHFGDAYQKAVFRHLKKSRENHAENAKALEGFLKLIMVIRGQEILNLTLGKTKVNAEMVVHMALSEFETD